jgi:anti-anti-sigma factor
MGLKLQTSISQRSVVVKCAGEVRAESTLSSVRNEIQQHARERRDVTLDLDGITYIDNFGFASLVGLYSSARAQGGTLRIRNLHAPIHYRRSAA